MTQLEKAIMHYRCELAELNNARDVELEYMAAYVAEPNAVNAHNLRDAWAGVARAEMMVHIAIVPSIG